ncbi:MAG: hypothetical protein U1F44_01920 [Coriobacteriia bacterium]|nr:hypothetical protein [Coriobacteriia bacterium]
MRTKVVGVLLGAVLVCASVTGCSTESELVDEPAVAETTDRSPGTTSTVSFNVGLSDLPDSRSRAVGVLGYTELEGGFWALYDTEPGDIPEGTPVVAVIANMGELDISACSLEDKLVVAEGVMSDGASARMAEPEIIVDDIYEVPDQ